MDANELEFSRDAFGHPHAEGAADLAVVSALLEEDAASQSAIRTLKQALQDEGRFAGNASEIELLAAGSVVKIAHDYAGPPAYLEPEEFQVLLDRWAAFVGEAQPLGRPDSATA